MRTALLHLLTTATDGETLAFLALATIPLPIAACWLYLVGYSRGWTAGYDAVERRGCL